MYQLSKRSLIRGITIPEVMVVMAVFVVIIFASYALMSSGSMGWHTGDTKIGLQEGTRQAMDVIVSELSKSVFTRVTIGAGGNSVTFQTPVDVDGGTSQGHPEKWVDTNLDGQVDFYLEDTFDSSGNVCWGAYLRGEDRTTASSDREGRRTIFLLVGDELIRQVLDSNKTTIIENFRLADNIENVSFIRRSNDVIEINLNANKLTVDRHPIKYSLSTKVHLRSNE